MRDERRWNVMYEQLKAYQMEFGDCMVPTKYASNRKLGNWVSNERRHCKLLLEGKMTSMTPERKRKLDDIGFVWLAPGAGSNPNAYTRKHVTPTTLTSSENKTSNKRSRFNVINEPVKSHTNAAVDQMASEQTNSILAAAGSSAAAVAAAANLSAEDYALSLDENATSSIPISIDAIVEPILKEVEVVSVNDPSSSHEYMQESRPGVNQCSNTEANHTGAAAVVAAGKSNLAEGNNSNINIWMCEGCGKTTFLKLSMCCGKKMKEAVVANI